MVRTNQYYYYYGLKNHNGSIESYGEGKIKRRIDVSIVLGACVLATIYAFAYDLWATYMSIYVCFGDMISYVDAVLKKADFYYFVWHAAVIVNALYAMLVGFCTTMSSRLQATIMAPILGFPVIAFVLQQVILAVTRCLGFQQMIRPATWVCMVGMVVASLITVRCVTLFIKLISSTAASRRATD